MQSTPHIDVVMLHIRCLHAVHAWYFCNYACASLKTQHVIWICVLVLMDWVYSLFHSALFFLSWWRKPFKALMCWTTLIDLLAGVDWELRAAIATSQNQPFFNLLEWPKTGGPSGKHHKITVASRPMLVGGHMWLCGKEKNQKNWFITY